MTGPKKTPTTFSDEEVEQLRGLLKSEDRVRWFWGTLRTWALWVSAVVAGVNYGWDALGRIIKYFATGDH